MTIEREKEDAMNVDLGQIILIFAVYYSVLALLIVSLFSLAVWGTLKYARRVSARHKELNRFAGSHHKGGGYISPPATLAG